MKFCDILWQETNPTYLEILQLPFLCQVGEGTLPEKIFNYYLTQDALYLKVFGEVVSLLKSLAPCARSTKIMHTLLEDIVSSEKAMQAGLLSQQEILEPNPSCRDYTLFLKETAITGDYAKLLVAILPCCWVYHEVGMTLHQKTNSTNPFWQWISLYADTSYHNQVRDLISLTNEAARDLPVKRQHELIKLFKKSFSYEKDFWHEAFILAQ